MERRKPEQHPLTAEEQSVLEQEFRVLQMAQQQGFTVNKEKGTNRSINAHYQLKEWDGHRIVVGKSFDVSLDHIETYLTKQTPQSLPKDR